MSSRENSNPYPLVRISGSVDYHSGGFENRFYNRNQNISPPPCVTGTSASYPLALISIPAMAQQSLSGLAADIEREARIEAEIFASDVHKIPPVPGVDWVPMLTVFFTHARRIRPDKNLGQATSTSHDPHDDNPPHVGVAAPGAVPPLKPPGASSWEWIWYVPAWSHPDYSDHINVHYNGRRYIRGTIDPTTRLRPAMRSEDMIRDPTPYAWRLGIHPDEHGGRSHFSPTIAPTRDPLEDFGTHWDSVTVPDQAQLIAETQRRGIRDPANPDNKAYVDQGVLEDHFSQYGIVIGRAFRDQVQAQITNGKSLEEIIADLGQNRPIDTQANTNFLNSALRDQDYQRFVFQGLTTDELIRNNIHTMSNAEFCDLGGQIHP